ncbi:hypothetical protein ACOSQ3_001482 [Xanthoceras sorbifolium]
MLSSVHFDRRKFGAFGFRGFCFFHELLVSDDPPTDTLATLWAKVCTYIYIYMCVCVCVCVCSILPHPTESFKLMARIQWSWEYKLIAEDEDLQQLFPMLKAYNVGTMRLDVELHCENSYG